MLKVFNYVNWGDFMSQDFLVFLLSAGAVTLAEMGDKTQLLAMAFATKYHFLKVLLGVLVATILNHGLAVLLGNEIAHIPSAQVWIQIIASLSFIFFGLWTIKGDTLDNDQNKTSRFGPFLTVAIAFFIAELGDKTQLATIALATKYPSAPFAILAGTTTGMLIADGLGIILGVVMCKRIPEKTIKFISAAAFIIFGFIGSWEVLVNNFRLSAEINLFIMLFLIILTVIPAYVLIKNSKNDTIGLKYCKSKE